MSECVKNDCNFHQAPILALTVFSIQKSAVQGQSPAAAFPHPPPPLFLLSQKFSSFYSVCLHTKPGKWIT